MGEAYSESYSDAHRTVIRATTFGNSPRAQQLKAEYLNSRRGQFEAGHDSAKPDQPLSGNYSPPKEQWSEEALRTVEDERERRLRE
jgi:hypothetical protein